MSLYMVPTQDNKIMFIIISPEASSGCDSFSDFSFLFMTLTILKSSVRYFVKCPRFGFVWWFSYSWTRWCVWGWRLQRWSGSLFTSVEGRHCQYYLLVWGWTLITVRLSLQSYPFPSLSMLCSLINVTMNNPHSRSGSYFPSLRVEYLT